MGLLKGAAPADFVQAAAERYKAGKRVHTIVWEAPALHAGSLADLSDLVEEVESVGWQLDHTESALVGASRPVILLLFRRREFTLPQ
ncbi:hypothetical protein [Peterkaempfera griseoplana]|uniref:hypothetical protein n=1 Tax=Peterkaempfera griseoplana TaxID=66896 RepID=UPI0006E2D53A|nr:hypothetical protein [Peterkaempfera griseoplana]